MAEINYGGGSNKKYYQIDKEGQLYRQAKGDETQGVYEHVKQEGANKGQVERRKVVKALQGFLYDFYYRQSEQYGEQFIIEIFDNGTLSLITLSTQSSYYDDFRRKLPNIKVGSEYQFQSWKMQKKDKVTGRPIDGFVYGISVKTVPDLVKIDGFFDKEKTNQLCPIDEAQKDALGKDYWKIYFVLLGNAFKSRVIPHYRNQFEVFRNENPVMQQEATQQTENTALKDIHTKDLDSSEIFPIFDNVPQVSNGQGNANDDLPF